METILALAALFSFSRFLIVLLHEYGHAIPAMMFTSEKVEIFLGSMGDISTPKIKLGSRLSVNFKRNPLLWQYGMVKHGATSTNSFFKDLIITVAGSLTPLALSVVTLYVCFNFDVYSFFKYFSIAFFAAAVYDLRNLYPSAKLIQLYDGTYTYCDGHFLLRLIKLRRHLPIIKEAFDHYGKNEFEQAAVIFESLPKCFVDVTTAEVVLYSYFAAGKFADLDEFYLMYNHLIKNQHSVDLILNLGVRESGRNNHLLALNYYTKALELDKHSYLAHSNIGYTYNLTGDYDKALDEFKAALAIQSDFPYGFSNMAISYLKLGMPQEAKEYLDKALKTGPDDPYTFKNLGIYYLERNEPEEALKHLMTAKQKAPDTHMLEYYITLTSARLPVLK